MKEKTLYILLIDATKKQVVAIDIVDENGNSKRYSYNTKGVFRKLSTKEKSNKDWKPVITN